MLATRSLIALGSSMVLVCSCVERKEHLSIQPGGVVLYQAKFDADSLEELDTGDAVPRTQSGWLVQRERKEDDDGKVTHALVAEKAFGPRNPLPENFASKSDPNGDLYLQFPTTLVLEQRADGEYYHFSRTYSARPWAVIEALEERLLRAPLDDLDGLKPEHWTPEQRHRVVQALANFETEKMLVFAREAFRHVAPEAPPDGWLAMRSHVLDCLAGIDYQALAELLKPAETPVEQEQLDQTIKAESAEFQEKLMGHFKEAARDVAGLNGSQAKHFLDELDRRRVAFEVTQDLGDEKFQIRVEMPGEIVASNATSVEGGTATWEFDGQTIRDREHELLVTSRIPR